MSAEGDLICSGAAAEQTLTWQPVYVGVGSNLEDPPRQVETALQALSQLRHSRLIKRSRLYASAPMGPQDQPDYVNAVAAMLTRLPPADFMVALLGLERDQGRRRDGTRWGPRTLDLDLLVYAGLEQSGPDLTLPHPGITERAFVAIPLAELAPFLPVPGKGYAASLAKAFDAHELRIL